jgi:hypothetical protein
MKHICKSNDGNIRSTYTYPMKNCKLPDNVLIIRQLFNGVATPITIQISISDFILKKHMFINKYIQLRGIGIRVAFLYARIINKIEAWSQ